MVSEIADERRERKIEEMKSLIIEMIKDKKGEACDKEKIARINSQL